MSFILDHLWSFVEHQFIILNIEKGMNHIFSPAFPVQTLSQGTQPNDEEEPSFIEFQLINAKGMAETENNHFTTQYDDGSSSTNSC